MHLLRPTMLALLIGAAAPAFVAPAYAQNCACPPSEGYSSGPVIQAQEPPPPLPVYEQPPIPAPGYVWTPGYWAWNTYDYYWVPGVWAPPPRPGVLWTPGYWAFVGGTYFFRQGYWAPHVGFYGGVNYGFGYNGLGYEGGRWEGERFVYNTTVNNFGGVRVTNVYTQNVTVVPGATRASFNGGPGGIALRPTPEQERLTTQERVQPTAQQVSQARAASMDAMQFRSANQGKPAVAATQRPGEFKGPGVVPAKAAGSAELTPAPAGAPNVAPGAEHKLPAGANLPAVEPSGAPNEPHKPNPGEKASLPPSGVERPANEPHKANLGEKPPAAALTPAEEKSMKTEAPNAQRLQERHEPGGGPNEHKPAEGAQRPGGPGPGPVGERMRPEMAPAGALKGPPGAEHKKPERPEGRGHECRPGEPCPK